jgi:hypothetical protein
MGQVLNPGAWPMPLEQIVVFVTEQLRAAARFVPHG